MGDLQEEQPFADLMESLLDESVRVSELNVAREEKTKERKIKAKALARDAEILKQELQGFNDNSWSISIVKDYIDQLQDLRRCLSQIQAMEEVEMTFPELTDIFLDEDGVAVTSTFTLRDWLLYKKRFLLGRKDKLEVVNREAETKRKMLLQDALRSSNRQKIQKLERRKHFLSWQVDYIKTKESLKNTGLPNWRSELVKIAKESLSMEADKKTP